MTTITVNVPAKVSVPRGADLVGSVYTVLTRAFAASARAREQRRAAATRVAEAAELRAYAQQMMNQDRRFAADLLSAADRHENGG
jgi:hypothetical protein